MFESVRARLSPYYGFTRVDGSEDREGKLFEDRESHEPPFRGSYIKISASWLFCTSLIAALLIVSAFSYGNYVGSTRARSEGFVPYSMPFNPAISLLADP